MKRKTVVALVIIVGLAAASAFIFVPSLTFHDAGAIHFGASLSATTVAQAQTVKVYLEDRNALDFKNSFSLPTSPSPLNLSSGPCGSAYPGGIAVYEGAYSLANVSAASPLPFYAPGGYDVCTPLFALTNSFTFGPLQNLTVYFDLAGYYTSGWTGAPGGGETAGVLHPYSPGVYTVVAGDPLGNARDVLPCDRADDKHPPREERTREHIPGLMAQPVQRKRKW